MNYINIIGTVILIVIIYYLIKYIVSSDTLTFRTNATDLTTIQADKLGSKSRSNFTYSIWLYIDNWNYRFGNTKYVITRGTNNFAITLGKEENNLNVAVKLASTDDTINNCRIDNIPIQKWVCCLVSVYGRAMDIYINGKLVKTCILDNVANIDPTNNIEITPHGGFSGTTANFRYIGEATNPEQAYNIYKKGVGGSFLNSIFNKYRFRIQFIKDNKTMTSLEI